MAENKSNNSYNNCINQLHARYEGRGVSASVSKELRAQEKREAAEPNAYMIARMNKGGVSDKYRNGDFNGQKYMTTGDFLKYYNTHKNPTPVAVQPKRPAPVTKEFKKPAVSAPEVRTIDTSKPPKKIDGTYTTVSKAVTKYDPKADTIVMPAQKAKRKVKKRVSALIAKWFPNEGKTEKNESYKKNIPVAVIGLIISMSIAMTMIIGTSVMSSKAQTEIGNLKYEVSELEAEADILEEELVKREDLAEIYEYATNELGMINSDYVSSVYIEVSEGDSVNGEGCEERNMSALLSAMFGE